MIARAPRPAGYDARPMQRDDYLRLVDEMTEHDRRYYVEASPTISDYEYDQLNQRLRKWAYRIPEYLFNRLSMARSELVGDRNSTS